MNKKLLVDVRPFDVSADKINESISENRCREIFNILQNAQPMSIEDVINSHQSHLVDMSRKMVTMEINGETIIFYLNETGSPALIRDPVDTDSMFVVMPMKT